MSSRRPEAVRLIEWTGERCVPWAPDIQVVYEHYHRYLWAQPLVTDRRVLDLGSGEGFGPAILAESAKSVVGVDIDPLTVEHARLNYRREGLEFREGSATDLSDFADGSFDAVVLFELIEHVAEQDDVMREVARVLAPGGLLILSTPDRRTYSAEADQANPFHEKELTLDELRDLLGARFENVELLNQRAATGSTIDTLEDRDGSHLRVRIERAGEGWDVAEPPPPYYLVAVASNAALPVLPAESTLSDHGIELARMAEREVDEGDRTQAKQAVAARQGFATKRMEGMRALALAREELAAAHDEVKRLYAETGALREEALRTEGSVAWGLFQTARGSVYGHLGGRTSRRGRLLSLLMRAIGRLAFGSASPVATAGRTGEPVVFPDEPAPDVSIVIPAHGGAGTLHKCLRAVAETADVPYEVIIVDDEASAAAKSVLRGVTGARVVVNDKNLGYLHSVNRGAALALGQYIVLLNDDTEPQARWLSALVGRAESAPDVGIVASKLLYPGGGLQEAGGIVWSDGGAHNFGRGHDQGAPEFNYVREVDYGSAAALLVRAEVWELAGGFDERFAPGYWEDVDLCFTAKGNGWRVLYEPKAEVVHFEGASMGTDDAGGGKHYQRLNASKFASKWSDALADQPRREAPPNPYLAADHRRGPAVLVVDDKVPTPDRDAGSSRMMALVEALVALDCRVLFVPDNGAPLQPYTRRLQAMGVEVLAGALGADVRSRLEQLGSDLRLAILSRPYVAPRYLHLVRRANPDARIVYDTVDLHFVREERRQLQDGSTDMGVPHAFRQLELGNARAADVTFVVTETERDRLLADCPDISVEVVPMAHDVWEEVPGPTSRAGLLFIGGFEHHPNVDAALHLCKEIMPLVHRELNGVKLSLVGPNPPSEVLALASDRVDVTGWVEDLRPLLETVAVSVAPLRYGGGMNGKITQSLAAGLPVVSSSVGSEGLGAEDGRHMFVADDPKLFAERVVDLHVDNDLWRSLSDGGRQLARTVTSRERQLDVLRRMLNRD